MASEVILSIERINSESSRLEAVNSLYRYSGVLDVDLNADASQIRVRYDATNILAEDIRATLEEAGYPVNFMRQ